MAKIKDASIIILIAFIIASILYGIHMFRYDFIDVADNSVVRYDRITNTQCMVISRSDTRLFRDLYTHVDPIKDVYNMPSCNGSD